MAVGNTLIYVVTEDWYFCSHRLALASAAARSGLRVIVVTRVVRHGDRITAAGLELIPLSFARRSVNPFNAFVEILTLARIYRRHQPDIVHHVALKPVLLGTAAAWLARVPRVVNAIAGLGYVFVSDSRKARLLRPLLRTLLALCLRFRRSHALVQNDTDVQAVKALGIPSRRISRVRGSGVDMARFAPSPEPPGPVVATMVSRMLKDKGVVELVEAARELRQRGCSLRVRLVGPPDPENPSSILRETLQGWHAEGAIEWLDGSEDVAAIWAASHVAVLPSYREGLPLSLLEAASCGRPMISTDVPGCRDVVSHERTGLLVPVRDVAALAAAIERLAGSRALRKKLGEAAREHVRLHFDQSIVVMQQLDLYQRLLSPPVTQP